MKHLRALVLIPAIALVIASIGAPPSGAAPAAAPSAAATAAASPQTLLAAGDIASCASTGDEVTATMLDAQPGTVITLGDNVYDSGTTDEFNACYNPSWGRHKGRTRPAAGNHEYETEDAAGYYGYFGAAAGDPAKGYYSFELGAWHLIALNSNCAEIGGCDTGSPQEHWLRADLAVAPRVVHARVLAPPAL